MLPHPHTAASRLRWFVCFLAAFLSACSASKNNGPTAVANVFMTNLVEGRAKEAYDGASFAFQVQQSFPSFAASVDELDFREVAAIAWQTQDIKAREATLEGEMVNRSEKKFRVVVSLVKESRAWKVYSFRLPGQASTTQAENPFSLLGKATAFNDASNRNLPTDREIVDLVRDAMKQFDRAVKQKSFSEFYKFIAVAWQAQLSEKRLQRAFQPFIDASIDLRDTAYLDPVFDRAPQIDASGLLIVNGYFPSKPYKLVFSLKYTYELPTWKLFGLNLNVLN